MPAVFAWETQSGQYANVRPVGPGITHFIGRLVNGDVDCLLMYDDELELVGIMNVFTVDMLPYERAGNFTVMVRPDRRRRGIATLLMDEARRRWTINFEQQDYSHDGSAFATRYVQRITLQDGSSRFWR